MLRVGTQFITYIRMRIITMKRNVLCFTKHYGFADGCQPILVRVRNGICSFYHVDLFNSKSKK